MASIRERKNKDGTTVYRVEIRRKGHPPQRATFERKTDARNWTSDIESAIRQGRHFKSTEAKKHTLADLIDRYIKNILPTKPKQIPNQKHQLEWWRDQIGAHTLADVTAAMITECRDKSLKERGPATTNRYLSALSHVFTIAVTEWEWFEDSPMRKVRKPKEPRGRVRYLSDYERERLLKACRESDNKYLYLVVVLAISTGMRKGEIMGLTWDDVDLPQQRITLYDTKNGEIRAVAVVGKALELLKDHAKVKRIDTPLLFPGKVKRSVPIVLRAPWLEALAEAKIEDFRFHDLRHSCASYLAMNGASLAEIAEVLGHKTLSMVKRYTHLSESHTKGVVARMNESIFGKTQSSS